MDGTGGIVVIFTEPSGTLISSIFAFGQNRNNILLIYKLLEIHAHIVSCNIFHILFEGHNVY